MIIAFQIGLNCLIFLKLQGENALFHFRSAMHNEAFYRSILQVGNKFAKVKGQFIHKKVRSEGHKR